MRASTLIAWMIGGAFLWIAGPTVWADPAREALKLYRQKRYDEAAKRWQEVLARHPEDPVVQYDLGAASYRQGQYQLAAQALSHALSSAGAKLRSRIAYNLGNSQYRQGQAKEASSPNEAMQRYQQALDAYKTAVQQDPRDIDAKFNYELTQERMKQLKAKAQQPQASQTPSKDPSSQQPASSTPHSGSGSEQAQQTPDDNAQQGNGQREQESAAQQGQQSEPQPGQQAQQQQATPSADRSQDKSASTSEAQSTKPSSSNESPNASVGGREASKAPQAEVRKSDATASDGRALSTQQALWILDAIQQEERTPLANRGQAQERSVERDW